ncbi:MAG: extracellular solute-binding protein [Streptosporangiales bacterium]|nr:extracellular solute-binding protein [Streptosporangiales bacterium]
MSGQDEKAVTAEKVVSMTRLEGIRGNGIGRRSFMKGTAGALLGGSALLGAPALLSGCGKEGGSGDDVLTIWHTEPTPVTQKALDEIIQRYQAENSGLKISAEPVAWADLVVKLRAALEAGNPPDIVQCEPMFVRTLQSQGLLRNVDEVVKSFADGDYRGFLEPMFRFEDGHYYGVPHAWGVDLISYRKDLYDRAGADPAQATWDDWKETLKKVTNPPDTYGLALAGKDTHNINEEVYMWVGSNGGRLFDADGKPTFTERPVLEMLEFWRDLAKERIISPEWTSMDYLATLSAVAGGKAASNLTFGRTAYTYQEEAPDLVAKDAFGVVPEKPVGPSGEDWITQLDAEPWVVFKEASRADEAIDFLKFFYGRDNYRSYLTTVPIQLLPILESMSEDPEYQQNDDIKRWSSWVDTQKKVAESGRARPLMVTHWQDLKRPYLVQIYASGVLADMVTSVAVDGEDPGKAAANAQRKAEQIVADYE